MLSTLKRDLRQNLIDALPSPRYGEMQHGEMGHGEMGHGEIRDDEACAPATTEQRRRQVLVLLAMGKTRREISAATGYSLRTIRQIVQRYRTAGANGLKDGRRRSPASTLLSKAQQQVLQAVLQQPPAGGGRWTGPKVAQWLSAVTGKAVHRQRGWEYLQRFGPKDVVQATSPAKEKS